MKYILPFLLTLCSCAHAAYNTYTITFTNTPAIGDKATVNGSARIWTNNTQNTVTWIQTNGPNGSATNLARNLGANNSALYSRQTASNVVVLSGLNATFFINGTYASVATNSLGTTNDWLVKLPFDNNYDTNRTNTASELLYGLGRYTTNSFPTGSVAMATFAAKTNADMVHPTMTNAFLKVPYLDRPRLTNSIQYGEQTVVTQVVTGVTRYNSGAFIQDEDGLMNWNFSRIAPDSNTVARIHDITLSSNEVLNAAADLDALLWIDTTTQIAASIAAGNTNTALYGNTRLDLLAARSVGNSSLANGYNSAVSISTASYNRLSGPSGAYTNAGFVGAGYDGEHHTLEFDNPAGMVVILNQSGLEPTAANRIITGTGAPYVMTNNPATARMHYSTTVSRWILEDTTGSTNASASGSATNAVETIKVNGVSVASAQTSLNFTNGTNTTVEGSSVGAATTIAIHATKQATNINNISVGTTNTGKFHVGGALVVDSHVTNKNSVITLGGSISQSFQPTSAYYSVDGSTGQTVTEGGMVFKNGLRTSGALGGSVAFTSIDLGSTNVTTELVRIHSFTNAVNSYLVTLEDGTADIAVGTVTLGASGPVILSGTGSPEGAQVAGKGSLFLRTDGGAGSTLYVKESGSGNTGWAAK